MTIRTHLALPIVAGALLALNAGVIGAQQSSSDLGEGALAQCWTMTVKVMTLMQGGMLNPALTAKQEQSLYAAIDARDAENYGECVKKLQDMPAVFQ